MIEKRLEAGVKVGRLNVASAIVLHAASKRSSLSMLLSLIFPCFLVKRSATSLNVLSMHAMEVRPVL